MKHSKWLILIAIIGALSVTAATAKTYYKWTDENGVTHYSARKPHQEKSEEVEIRGGRQTSVEQERPEAQSGDSAAEGEQAAAGSAPGNSGNNREKAVDMERCEAARQNLQVLTNNARVRGTDENGEIYYLSEEEKQQELERVQQIIDRSCP